MMPQKKATVTYTLMGINIGIFFLSSFYFVGSAGPGAYNQFMMTYGLVPALFYDGSWWQPVTSMFLHANHIHILVNMIALWSLGIAIESTVGSYRYSWLYAVSGLTGALAVVVFQPDLTSPTVGASGAIAGLLGALAIFYPNSMMLVFFIPMKARTAAILFGIGSLLFAYYDDFSHLSHLGHLGGLVGGFLYARFALGLKMGKQSLRSGRGGAGFSDHAYGATPAGPNPEEGSGAGRIGSARSRADGGLSDLLDAIRGAAGDNKQSRGPEVQGRSTGDTIEITRPDGSTERVINPTGEEVQQSRGEEGRSGRIYYDPATGRFYVK